MGTLKRIAMIGVIAVATLATSLVAITPAQAKVSTTTSHISAGCNWDDDFSFKYNGARIRTRPTTSATIVGLGYIGQYFRYNGGYSNGWFQGYNCTTGVAGWVHTSVLYAPPHG